jgi:hypothetical protein
MSPCWPGRRTVCRCTDVLGRSRQLSQNLESIQFRWPGPYIGARKNEQTMAATRRAQKRKTGMICVTIAMREGPLTRRVRIRAPSIERALEIAGYGKPGRKVRLLFPIDPEAFFMAEPSGRSEAA